MRDERNKHFNHLSIFYLQPGENRTNVLKQNVQSSRSGLTCKSTVHVALNPKYGMSLKTMCGARRPICNDFTGLACIACFYS
jgi:hypothetical protein